MFPEVEAMMLQPFLYNIIKKGEIGLMVFGGKVTHAVLKKVKDGDFRVQDDFGGSAVIYSPTEDEIAFAELSIAACEELPTYARVDIVWDNEGETLGGYMVVSLIFLIGVQLITGLFSYDDFMAEGPLNYMVSDEVADFMVYLASDYMKQVTGQVFNFESRESKYL